MARKVRRAKPMMSLKNIAGVFGVKPSEIINPDLLQRVRMAVWLDSFYIEKQDDLGDTPWVIGLEERGVRLRFEHRATRGDCVAMRNALIDKFQRHISLVRKDLDNEWGRRVRERDGNQCTQCGAVKDLTAHHWCRNAQRSRAARWCLDNGITLCYACHIRFAHERPDWLLYDSYRRHVVATTGRDTARVTDNIELVSGLTLDDKTIRRIWYDWGLHDVNGKYAVMAEIEMEAGNGMRD